MPSTIARFAADRIGDDIEIAGVAWRANLKAHLGGFYFVREFEHPDRETAIKLDSETTPFFSRRFTDAIDHFERQRFISSDEVFDIVERERDRSRVVSRALSGGVARLAQGILAEAIEPDGPGLDFFIASLQGLVDTDDLPVGKTLQDRSRLYLEQVFRTTLATSYNAGRQLSQEQIPEGSGLVWEYVTAGDNRVRHAHEDLDGKQFALGDATGRMVYPPNGFQCRCVMVVTDEINDEQMQRPVDLAGSVTSGFEGAPLDTVEREAA